MTSKYGYLANLIKFRHDFGRFASSEEARTAPFPPGGANCAMLPPSSSPNRAHSVGPRFGLAASGRFFYPLRLVLANFVRRSLLHSASADRESSISAGSFFLSRKRSRSPKLSLVNAAFTLGLRFVLASSISSRLLAGSKARSFRCSSSPNRAHSVGPRFGLAASGRRVAIPQSATLTAIRAKVGRGKMFCFGSPASA